MVNNGLFVFGILKHLLCVDACLALYALKIFLWTDTKKPET